MDLNVSYTPPGPVAAAFHADNSFVRGLKGPVGSGKSSTCCFEIVSRAIEQHPYNGVRLSRWVAIRNTYPELKSTTIKTFMDWFGDENGGPFTIKWDSPIVASAEFGLEDGTRVKTEVWFLALDRPEDVGKLKSLEATGLWLNEANELEKRILDMATQRVGRYPAKRVGGPTWSGVIMDTNPPDDDHWWYILAEEERPEGFKFFDQPGGLTEILDKAAPNGKRYEPNPNAENVENLPGGYEYYIRQMQGKDENYINVFLLGQYGTTRDGKPVYPEYKDGVHLSKTKLIADPRLPIVCSFDFGLTPAAAFGQMTPKGQVLILAELCSEDMGIRQFYTDAVLPFRNSFYRQHIMRFVGDPAGHGRSQNDAKSAFEELRECGVACEGADSNDPSTRQAAVKFFLTRMSVGEPGFLLDPSCKVLRKGFNGSYMYERVRVSGTARYKDQPAKNKYSHPHDALQYLCMYLRGGTGQTKARPVKRSSMAGWT